MKWIDYASPNKLEEAVDLLAEKREKARILAGGTDLLVLLRANPSRINNPDLIINGKEIPELNELSYNSNSGLTIGAAVPCYKIYQNAEIAKAYPGLIDSASLIGGIQIQGRASIGGNLCNAAPSGDAIPTLIAHSAICKIAGPSGTREIAVEDFCTGPGKTVVEPGELLVSIHLPSHTSNFGARYIRFIPRNEMDIAVVGVGVSVELDNGNIKSTRIALASVAPTPLLVEEAGDVLMGKPANEETFKLAGQISKKTARPISDMRGTIEYRKHLCDVLTRRALNAATVRAQGGVVNVH